MITYLPFHKVDQWKRRRSNHLSQNTPEHIITGLKIVEVMCFWIWNSMSYCQN